MNVDGIIDADHPEFMNVCRLA